ncbi:MAG: TRAM domain-containing protein [Candidatus Micrarchaeaceae archaeon]|jgi:predicted RNA-binding protein with TRAM domain
MVVTNYIVEGSEHEVKVIAKGASGEGISRIEEIPVIIRNAKIRIGNTYKVKITKVYRTFVYAELNEGKEQMIGTSVVEL